MADYHNPQDVKFMLESGQVRKSYRQRVQDLFRAPKNVRYMDQLLHRRYRTQMGNFDTQVEIMKFNPEIMAMPNFNQTDVWKGVKSANYQFFELAGEQFKTVSKYKESKSYLQREFEANHLYPKGFENLNKDARVGWGSEYTSGGDWIDPEDRAWEEGQADDTAEETLAKYYGTDSTDTETYLRLRKKYGDNIKRPVVGGTPAVLERKPRINPWNRYGRALDMHERDIQRPVNLEDNFEYETPVRANYWGSQEFQSPLLKKQPARAMQFILP